MLDEAGFTDKRSGRVELWDEVTLAEVDVHQGAFGESHSLTLKLENRSKQPRPFVATNSNNPDKVSLSLDMLSVPWQEVVEIIENTSKRRVVIAYSAGFRRAVRD